MKTTVTSGERNNKTYKISFDEEGNFYELLIYNRRLDQFEQQGGEFNSLAEAEEYLDNTYGRAS